MSNTKARNSICIWYEKDALAAARFYAATFPDSEVTAICKAPGDYQSGKEGDILTVEFTVCGIPCLGLNGGPMFDVQAQRSLLFPDRDGHPGRNGSLLECHCQQRRRGTRVWLVQSKRSQECPG